jgi:hypothetical protein
MGIYEKDHVFILSTVEVLSDYLLSSKLYWPFSTSAGPEQVSLTPGTLLLSTRRIQALSGGKVDAADLSSAMKKIEDTIKQWRANWIKKCEAEVPSRLNLWQNYLKDLVEDRYSSRNDFSHEVRHRVILALLEDDLGKLIPAEVKREESVDQLLHSLSGVGDFVWEAELKNAFPKNQFWFLYVDFRKA